MAKSIVILFDGTSNQISSNRSNVLRLYGVLTKSAEQLVYYDPGVGTFGSANAISRLWSKAIELRGLATGYGLDDNVKQAYRFLVDIYRKFREVGDEREARDRIYILGFSRGAYTARVLAGFINTLGMIEPRNLNLLDYAYRAYKRIGEHHEDDDSAFAEIKLFQSILQPDRGIPIRMLGLFDTVASVIESGRFGPRLKSHAYTNRNPSVETIAHAVSIDDRRTMFRVKLWNEGEPYWGSPFRNDDATPQELEQVWFRGYHADVGGGHPEAESGLCKVPLVWMIDQAKACGLDFKTRTVNSLVLGKDPKKSYVPPDPLGPMHNSMNAGWAVLEFLPRRKPKGSRRPSLFGWTIPLFERRNMPARSKLHPSVIERREETGDWPPNIPDDFTT